MIPNKIEFVTNALVIVTQMKQDSAKGKQEVHKLFQLKSNGLNRYVMFLH